jgi:hypothetical protein
MSRKIIFFCYSIFLIFLVEYEAQPLAKIPHKSNRDIFVIHSVFLKEAEDKKQLLLADIEYKTQRPITIPIERKCINLSGGKYGFRRGLQGVNETVQRGQNIVCIAVLPQQVENFLVGIQFK